MKYDKSDTNTEKDDHVSFCAGCGENIEDTDHACDIYLDNMPFTGITDFEAPCDDRPYYCPNCGSYMKTQDEWDKHKYPCCARGE